MILEQVSALNKISRIISMREDKIFKFKELADNDSPFFCDDSESS